LRESHGGKKLWFLSFVFIWKETVGAVKREENSGASAVIRGPEQKNSLPRKERRPPLSLQSRGEERNSLNHQGEESRL